MSVEVTFQNLLVSLTLFVLVQGVGIVKAEKLGSLLYYYIPVTIIAGAVFWASIIFYPAIIG